MNIQIDAADRFRKRPIALEKHCLTWEVLV